MTPTQRTVVCPHCGWSGRRRGAVAGPCRRCGTLTEWSPRGAGPPPAMVAIPRGLARKLLAALQGELDEGESGPEKSEP